MKRPALWLALLLFLLTAALLFYRIAWLEYPLFPTAPGKTWQLTINAHVLSVAEKRDPSRASNGESGRW
jgi:hypothetical protein